MKHLKNKANLKVKIIGGAWKGRYISFVDKKNVRPTKNQIRETLFNWLKDDIKNAVCADLFSGSGALGFEAASRGAKKVFLIDNDIEVTNYLSNQIDILKAQNITLINSTAEDFIKSINEKINLVFLDPPFSDNKLTNIISNLNSQNILSNECKIYIETACLKDNLDRKFNVPKSWQLLKTKKSGRVSYMLFKVINTMV
tara:strand:- start:415 stop:1011 length:597 start_codon:yes stop_codon:yes gene_type:complete